MQVTETLAEGLKHEFQVSVPATDLDAKADERLDEMKDKVRINGLPPRQGAGRHLKSVYGRSVMAEAIEQTVRETNPKIVTERGFKLATEPKVTLPTDQDEINKLLDGKSDLNYTVAIEVIPPIALADFKAFKHREAGRRGHRRGRRRGASSASPSRTVRSPPRKGAKAEKGDRVTIAFVGTIDGEAVRGRHRRGHAGADRLRPPSSPASRIS